MENAYKLIIIDNKNKIYEYVKTRSLEELDSYTVHFESKEELLEEMLKNLEKEGIEDIKVKDLHLMINDHTLPIMYKKDNFNYNDLLNKYEQYLLSHKDQIAEMDEIKYVGKNLPATMQDNTIYGYTKNGNYAYIPDSIITYCIDNYIMSDYSRLRKAYFNLKMRQIDVKIDPVKENQEIDNIDRDEILSLYDLDDLSGDEKYFDGQGKRRR